MDKTQICYIENPFENTPPPLSVSLSYMPCYSIIRLGFYVLILYS